jgi:putative membrane protein
LIRNAGRCVFVHVRVRLCERGEVDVVAVNRLLRCRRLAGVATGAMVLVLLGSEVARAEPGVPVPPNGLLSDRGKGDVSEADRDFAVKVRLAGLWEIPAGEMAQQKSTNRRIQAIGRDIAAQHEVLDKMVRDAAKKLDVSLPGKPNADQQTWLTEMREAEGAEFDQIYIDRLRAAHGKIFPAIAAIRASTRNDTVRKLAQRANQFVMTHMTLLESSGIVDFAALPTVPPPAPAANRSTGEEQVLSAAETSEPLRTPIIAAIAIVLVAGLATTFIATRRLTHRRPRRYRGHRDRFSEF